MSGTAAPRPRGRRPGRSDTREAILRAARDLFAERGYERATMRSIARRADVDAALIVHYFGSKDDLLAAALEPPFDPAEVLEGVGDDPDRMGEELVRRFIRLWDEPAANRHLVAMLRTGMSDAAAMAGLRRMMERTVLAVLAGLVDDGTARLRVSLVASQTGGLILARYLLALPEVAERTPEELAALVGPSIQRYLTGDLPLR